MSKEVGKRAPVYRLFPIALRVSADLIDAIRRTSVRATADFAYLSSDRSNEGNRHVVELARVLDIHEATCTEVVRQNSMNGAPVSNETATHPQA
jgi:hypothetical protein